MLMRLLLNSLAVIIAAFLLPGVHLDGFLIAIVVAVVLGVINIFLKPILLILTLPINIFTLGLFTLVINAVLVQLASAVVPGFTVENFWWALLFSVLLSLVNAFLHSNTRNRPPRNEFTSPYRGYWIGSKEEL